MAFDETYEAGGLIWGVIETDGAQTATVLEAAPGAGKFIQVVRAYVSKETAGEIRLEDEDDNLVAGWALASGGFGHFEIPGDVKGAGGVKLPANKALELDTTGADATFVNVLYRIVSR
jgi:hypothetical protein